MNGMKDRGPLTVNGHAHRQSLLKQAGYETCEFSPGLPARTGQNSEV